MQDYNTHVLVEDIDTRQRQLFYELNSRFETRVKLLVDEVHQLRKSNDELKRRDEQFVDILQAHADQCARLVEACRVKVGQSAKPQQSNGAGTDNKKSKNGVQAKGATATTTNTTATSTTPPIRGATFPWPPIPPGPHDAKKDFTDLVPFLSFTGLDFDKWAAGMDRLWFGHKDPLYRAELLTAFRTEAKGTVAFWIIGADPDFLRQATWPDIKAQMREYFSAERKGKVELEQWRKFLADARGGNDFLNSVGLEELRNVMPVIEKQSAAYFEVKRTDGKPWGASLASGPLSGIFSRGTAKDKEPENGQDPGPTAPADANGTAAATTRATSSPTAKQKQQQQATTTTGHSPAVNKTARPSTIETPASSPSRSSTTTSPTSAPARQSTTSSSPTPSAKAVSPAAAASATTISTHLPPLRSDKGASASTKQQPSPTPPTFEDLVDVVGTYNGDPKVFARWSRKVDDLWYANDDPLYRKSLMNALPNTLTYPPLSWLASSTGTVDFLQKASWNDWKVVLGAHWGGSYAVTEGTTSPFLSRVKGGHQKKKSTL